MGIDCLGPGRLLIKSPTTPLHWARPMARLASPRLASTQGSSMRRTHTINALDKANIGRALFNVIPPRWQSLLSSAVFTDVPGVPRTGLSVAIRPA